VNRKEIRRALNKHQDVTKTTDILLWTLAKLQQMPFGETAAIINPTTQQPSGKSNVDDFQVAILKRYCRNSCALTRSKQKAGI